MREMSRCKWSWLPLGALLMLSSLRTIESQGKNSGVYKEVAAKHSNLATLDGHDYKPPPVKPRWNSSKTLLTTQTKATGLANSDKVLKNNSYRNRTSKRKRKRMVLPTGPPRPNNSVKFDVLWFDEYRSYSLKASSDARFRIRHAPIPAPGSPWPLPQIYRPRDEVFHIHPGEFVFHSAGENCDILDYTFDRVKSNIFGDIEEDTDIEESGTESYRIIRHINVTVLKECDKYPHLEMDESYDLEVKKTGASIIAREVWGAVRGLETFSQLIYQDNLARYLVNRTFINDYPRFQHRGILLDTARHYLKKENIFQNLEAMAQNKMNVLHWHMVDDQSFPFQSQIFPELSVHGAFDPVTHVYTHDDIREIIEQARLRGIRVIPEFDTPGHTFSWGYSQDHLLTPCYTYNNKPDGYFGPLNPILKSTYRFIRALFTEILTLFPEKYMHLGGDEVPFDCWASNPFIKNFIRRNNLTDTKDLLSLYEKKVVDIVREIGLRRPGGSGSIVWQEVYDNGVKLPADSIIQVWMGDSYDVDRITESGYRVIYSTCWYLDYINYGQDWDKYYKCEQMEDSQYQYEAEEANDHSVAGNTIQESEYSEYSQEKQLTENNSGTYMDDNKDRNSSLLVGGEACLWMEFADNENFMQRLWPRASAAAERLWSSKHVIDFQTAAPRIEEQRCRMISRGLSVGVLGGPGICKNHRRRKLQKTKLPDRKQSVFWPNQKPQQRFAFDDGSRQKHIYVVDMNAMYVVPLVIVVAILCLTLLSALQDHSHKSRLVAILTYPVTGFSGTSRKGVRGLLFGFLIFAIVWCVWTSPIWLNAWEGSTHRQAR